MKTEYGEVEYDDTGRAIWAGGALLGPAHQVAGGTWLICDREQLQLLLDTLMEQRERCVGLDTEYDGVDRGGDDDKSPIGKAHIVCTQFGIIDDELGKHPTLPHVTLARRVFLPNFGRAETEGWLRELRPWFESPDHWKVGSFVFSTEYHVFRNHGINLYGIRGCGVRQSQTWRMGKTYTHGLKPLGTEIFGYEMREFDEVFSTPKLKKDGTPYANNQRLSIPLQEAFTDPLSALYNSGLDYASLDAKVSVEGDQHMRHELDKMPWRDGQSMLTHYDSEWNPYQYVIAGMEDAGWPVDVSWFREQHTQAVKDQAEVAERLRQWAKCDVKWSSNPQKVHFLYGAGEAEIAGNKLIGKGFPISPICKSGPTEHWDGTQTKSTDKVALEWIRDHVKRKEDKAGVADLLYWTKIDKLRSSFLETIPTWVNKWGMVNSRIGPNAETNRLTVRQPALQTLSRPGWDPIKREGDPYSIREGLSAQPDVFNSDVSRYMHEWMWIAEWDEAQQRFVKRTITGVNPEEWFGDNLALLSHDYSQLEMRILAHYLVVLFNDYSLAHDLAAGDLHAATALRVWGSDPLLKGLTPKEVKDSKIAAVKMFRNRGKIVNFSVNYGKTAVGLGVDIRDEDGEPIGPKAAEEILRQYFAAYPAILRYHQWAKNYVRQNGYVRTLDGRYRYLPKIYSPHKGARGEAERAALNTPIQGSAAGIIMKAMLKCNTLPVPDLRRLGYFNEVLYDCGVRLVMQIHDELVHRCPRRHAKEAAAEIQRVMEHPFDDDHRGFVKSGLPLPVEFAIGTNYNEVK